MVWLLRLAARNVFRNTRRSLLTTATVLLGTAMLTVALSFVGGLLGGLMSGVAATAGEVRIVTPEYELREALMPLDANIAPVEPVLEAVRARGYAAHPFLSSGVTATVGEDIGEVFCQVVGSDPSYYAEVLDLDERLVAGRLIEAERGESLLGLALAEDLGAEVGDELVVLGQTQDGSMSPVKTTVVGVVDVGNIISNRQAFMSLAELQWMIDLEGGALQVYVDSGADIGGAREVAQDLAQDPALAGLTIQAWNERDTFRQIYDLSRTIHFVLAGGIVFITALGVLNTMMMSVLERTGEVGVLRAMGMKGPSVVFMFVVEGLGIGLVGSVLGLALGTPVALYLQRHGIEIGQDVANKVAVPVNSTFYADLTPEIAVSAFLLGLLIAALGALVPALRATSIQPVDAMRSHR